MNKQTVAVAAVMMLSCVAQAQDGGWSIYAGADYLMHEVSISDTVAAQSDTAPNDNARTERLSGDGSSVRLRGGMWLNEDFSVELQTTVSSDGVTDPGSAEIESYYGLFINARAQPFEWMDVLFPVGFASVDARVRDTGTNPDNTAVEKTLSASNDGLAFGMNFQIRLGELLADPDSLIGGLGIGAGFMVYNSSNNGNVRGYNAGIHLGLDF